MNSLAKTWEKFLPLAFLLALVTVASVPAWMAERAQTREKILVAALEEQRMAGAQIEWTPWKKSTGAVDYGAVRKTEYLTQAPAHLVAAMRRQEMGRPYVELGYFGKTQFAVENFEPSTRQYGEAGREATRELWRWVQADKNLWEDYTDFLAHGYVSGTERENNLWARNVRALAKQERANLNRDQEAHKKTKR